MHRGERPPTRPGLVRPVPLDPTGRHGPTPGAARGPRWRRSSHGLFVPSDVDADHPEQRILEAETRLPRDTAAAVTGWAGLRWLGADWLDGRTGAGGEDRLDVTVVCPTRDLAPVPGCHLSAERLGLHEVVEVDGVRVTTPTRSVVHELRYAGWAAGVTVADMACHADLVSRDELTAYLEGHPGWTGIARARRALEAVVENSRSPGETRTRLICLDAGIDGLRCNVPVFDRSGRHVATPDLLDEEAGLAIEYDGHHHLTGRQRHLDVTRESRMRDVGLEYLTVLAADVHAPDALLRRIISARRRAPWAPADSRAWTTTPPSGHRDRTTVARRLAHPAYQSTT